MCKIDNKNLLYKKIKFKKINKFHWNLLGASSLFPSQPISNLDPPVISSLSASLVILT